MEVDEAAGMEGSEEAEEDEVVEEVEAEGVLVGAVALGLGVVTLAAGVVVGVVVEVVVEAEVVVEEVLKVEEAWEGEAEHIKSLIVKYKYIAVERWAIPCPRLAPVLSDHEVPQRAAPVGRLVNFA